MIDFFANYRNLLLLLSVILAILLILSQYISNYVNDRKAENNQNILQKANKTLQGQVAHLTDQNIQLLTQLTLLQNKAELLHEIGNMQLKATFYTESLNSKIGKIKFRINFKSPVKFKDICPLKFGFELFTISNRKLEFRNFIEDDEAYRNTTTGKWKASMYKIYALSMKDGSSHGSGQKWGDLQTEMTDLVIPISLQEDIGLLRDFHDEKFFVWLPANIIDNANFIELVVNGWAILHEDIEKSTWDKVQMSRLATWNNFLYKDLELFRNYKGDRSSHFHPGWKINLYKSIPPQYESVQSRWSDF